MKKVLILGTGCPKCKKTIAIVEQAKDELGLTDISIEKVEDLSKIMEYEVMRTPAVVVDSVVRVKGRVPSLKELKEILS